MELTSLSVKNLSDLLKKKEISSVELTKNYLQAIEDDDRQPLPLNAYISVSHDDALHCAELADHRIKHNDHTPLTGIPIGIKDLINMKNQPTTCASKILTGFIAADDATVVERLVRKEGMPPLGKLNLDEFAMGSSNETSFYGPARNPYDRERTPGGSSGGSSAAVAGGLAPVSLGTDTGGSIRQPAAFCGCVGLKGTYGRVSRYGATAFASSLDQIGPIARTVEDAALLFSAMAGHDPKDSTSLPMPAPKIELNQNIKGLKIGLPKEFFDAEFDVEIRNRITDVVALLEKEGAVISEISIPDIKYAPSIYYILAPAEASANLERFDGIRYGNRVECETLAETYVKSRTEGFGTEVKRRIMLGTFILSSESYDDFFVKAQKVRARLQAGYQEALASIDVLLGPTTPTTAFKLGEKIHDPISMYLSDIFTLSANLVGAPAISVPVGLSENRLPIGLQIMAKQLDEQNLFNCAYAVEQFGL